MLSGDSNVVTTTYKIAIKDTSGNLLFAEYVNCNKTGNEAFISRIIEKSDVILLSPKECETSKFICNELIRIRGVNTDLYHVLLRNCEFFEAVGLTVSDGQVSLDDILARFEVGIIRVYVPFSQYILYLENDSKYFATSSKLYQHAISLEKMAILYYK